jgi:hypothetical protein
MEELANVQKFKNLWKKASGSSFNHCGMWQHQPPDHCEKVWFPKNVIILKDWSRDKGRLISFQITLFFP